MDPRALALTGLMLAACVAAALETRPGYLRLWGLLGASLTVALWAL